jgi:hypothetical protein
VHFFHVKKSDLQYLMLIIKFKLQTAREEDAHGVAPGVEEAEAGTGEAEVGIGGVEAGGADQGVVIDANAPVPPLQERNRASGLTFLHPLLPT